MILITLLSALEKFPTVCLQSFAEFVGTRAEQLASDPHDPGRRRRQRQAVLINLDFLILYYL